SLRQEALAFWMRRNSCPLPEPERPVPFFRELQPLGAVAGIFGDLAFGTLLPLRRPLLLQGLPLLLVLGVMWRLVGHSVLPAAPDLRLQCCESGPVRPCPGEGELDEQHGGDAREAEQVIPQDRSCEPALAVDRVGSRPETYCARNRVNGGEPDRARGEHERRGRGPARCVAADELHDDRG